jgi:hypothetical protein
MPDAALAVLRATLDRSDPRKSLSMNGHIAIAIAGFGVFIGSLLSDALIGDGIHAQDIVQAMMVALIAAAIQWWLLSRKT